MAAKTTEPLLVAIAAMFTPTFAFAHTGVGEASGFLHGFGHPISGLDHILAMVMVSFFAWQLGGRALWFVPVVFVALMAIGGALGVVGVELRVVEVGLALSSVVLGVIVALGTKPPLAAAMSIVGFFAIFHGYVHGADMLEDAGGLAYAAGFVVATALLEAAGICLCFRIEAKLASITARSLCELQAASLPWPALGFLQPGFKARTVRPPGRIVICRPCKGQEFRTGS